MTEKAYMSDLEDIRDERDKLAAEVESQAKELLQLKAQLAVAAAPLLSEGDLIDFYKGAMKEHRDNAIASRKRYEKAEAERDALAAFKVWVHSYLDNKGVPTHLDGPHSKEGCRIGDRMDLVFDELEMLRGMARVLIKRRCEYGFGPGESCVGEVQQPCAGCMARIALPKRKDKEIHE